MVLRQEKNPTCPQIGPPLEDSIAQRESWRAGAKALTVDLAVIVLLWCLSAIVANPIGDFPLNDDWAYGTVVKHLIDAGEYRPIAWDLPSFVSNMLWGALFCVPSGFSFTALRVSTLSAALLGLVGNYLLLRELKQPRWVRVIATLTLGFNPVYYALSHTFMTDVLFSALLIWAAFFLARSLENGAGFQLFVGSILSVAATLSRQFGLCIPVAFAVVYLLRRPVTTRAVLSATAPLAFSLLSFLTLRWWLSISGWTSSVLDEKTLEVMHQLADPGPLVRLALDNAFVDLDYLGLFLLPIMVIAAKDCFRRRSRTATTLAVAGLLIFVAGATFHTGVRHSLLGLLMPTSGNVLSYFGIGPLTLRDVYILRQPHVLTLPIGFWLVVTTLAILGAVLLIVMLSVRIDTLVRAVGAKGFANTTHAAGFFLLLGGSIYFLVLLAVSGTFDRYLIPVLPLLAAGILATPLQPAPTDVAWKESWARVAAPILLACFGLFSVCATRDYLTWNRIRWIALTDLMNIDGVTPRQIDGGFEFNGLHLYDPKFDVGRAMAENAGNPTARSWWWVSDDTYVVAFGPLPGYAPIRAYAFQNWLPRYSRMIVVLRKQ